MGEDALWISFACVAEGPRDRSPWAFGVYGEWGHVTAPRDPRQRGTDATPLANYFGKTHSPLCVPPTIGDQGVNS